MVPRFHTNKKESNMGFLGGIANSVVRMVKPLAHTAIQAIAPQATQMLKGVIGDLFTAGKGALNTFLALSPLPSPLKSLAQKLLGQGFDKLKGLAEGALDKAIAQLVQSLAPRPIRGTNVTAILPRIPERINTAAANTPTASSAGAATGSGTVSGGSSGTQGTQGSWGWSGGPPDPSKFDMKDPNQAAAFQSQMLQYQQAMNNISTFFTALSNAYKAMSDTQKGIASNLR
jgi:hypothetical protein